MEKIDAIYFINLDHREDRLREFLGEMQKIGFPKEKIHRIPAVYNPDAGVLGCALSHKLALETFLKTDSKNCLVFEDDFMFSLDINYCKFLLKHIFETKPNFDLVMLSGNIFKEELTDSQFLHHVFDGQTTSSYLISREFAPTLKQNFSEGADLFQNWFSLHKEKKHEYCLDIYWKQLQSISQWFIVHPKMGVQRESYSDTTGWILLTQENHEARIRELVEKVQQLNPNCYQQFSQTIEKNYKTCLQSYTGFYSGINKKLLETEVFN